MRSKATQLQREKGALASATAAASGGPAFRSTQLSSGASARSRAMMMPGGGDYGGPMQMRGNSGHAYGQRVNVMVKKCGALEMRAVKAEAELADANDLIERLEGDIGGLRDREAALCARIEDYGTRFGRPMHRAGEPGGAIPPGGDPTDGAVGRRTQSRSCRSSARCRSCCAAPVRTSSSCAAW